MVASMTCFASVANTTPHGDVMLELKSVNHRFLELSFKLPEGFRELERELRNKIKSHVTRGKFDIQIKLNPAQDQANMYQLNNGLVNELMSYAAEIHQRYPDIAPPNMMTLLRTPEVLLAKAPDLGTLSAPLFEAFEQLMCKAVEMRAQEGEVLKQAMLSRVADIRQLLETLEQHIPAITEAYQAKLLTRLERLDLDQDTTRADQEIALITQKMDVAEELDRLRAHLDEVARLLDDGGVCGRRLDFLMQEMHREANTLGVKILDKKVSTLNLDLKVLIEQIREQVQNIE